MHDINLTIRLRKEAAPFLDDAVWELQRTGLRNVQVNRRFLIIHGSASVADMDRMGRLASVESVRIATEFSAA